MTERNISRFDFQKIKIVDGDETYVLVDIKGKPFTIDVIDNQDKNRSLKEEELSVMAIPDPLLVGLPKISSIPSEDELLGN